MKINKLIHIVLAINIGVLCFALMAWFIFQNEFGR